MSNVELAKQLDTCIERFRYDLQGINPDHISLRPAPDKWSIIEILGHLVDSACNNHRRFVLATGKNDLVFEGYDQGHWVSVQEYKSASWKVIVHLWYYYNKHLVHLIKSLPQETVSKEQSRHSFDTMAFKLISSEEPSSLAYLIVDYIDHMNHHLNQIVQIAKEWQSQ